MRPESKDVCAYYARCSTPKQRLEHQRESVLRWCGSEGIVIPEHLRFEDKGGRRHRADKRDAFQRLLTECQEGRIEWVLISAFDRWGVADVDEFFVYRNLLRRNHVRLWSVQDELDLTGCDDGHYWRIVGQALAATAAMTDYANRNIGKMVQMALDGWHASKEHPYGTDLMCCRIVDKKPLFRVHLMSQTSRKSRMYRIVHCDDNGNTANEETTSRMPPRDGKTTGYRLVPSIDTARVEAVVSIFELYDAGLEFGQISDHLYAKGILYFGKAFGFHAVEAILKNPAYIGRPAWGKTAVGHYRQVFELKSEKPRERERDQPLHYDKGECHYVSSKEVVFAPPIVPNDLFARVHERLGERQYKSKPRRRNRHLHALNGMLVCPDCGVPMVNSWGTLRSGDRIPYFICSTYAKTRRKECRANSVAHRFLDQCANQLLSSVQDKLDSLGSVDFTGSIETLKIESITHATVVVQLLCEMCEEVADTFSSRIAIRPGELSDNPQAAIGLIRDVLKTYEEKHSRDEHARQQRVAEIDVEIQRIGDLLETTPSETLSARWHARLLTLESEKAALLSKMSLLDQLAFAAAHSKALGSRLEELRRIRTSEIWRVFLQRVTPIMECELLKNGKTRTKVQGFRFTPKESARGILGDALDFLGSRRGTG